MVGAPVILGTKDLLHDVAHATLTTVEWRNVACDLLDIDTGICGASRDTDNLKDWNVRHIIAHIENLVVIESILVTPLAVGAKFGGLPHKDVRDTQTLIPLPHCIAITTSNDGDMIA